MSEPRCGHGKSFSEDCVYCQRIFQVHVDDGSGQMRPLTEREKVLNNVTPLGTITKLEIPVERVLDGAKAFDLRHVIVAGTDKHGKLHIFTSNPQAGVNNLLLDCAKVQIVNDNVVARPMMPED